MIDPLTALSISGPGAGIASRSLTSNSPASSKEVRPGEDFASLLAGFAAQSIATMRQGEQAAVAGIKGEMPIQQVVDKVMAAEQALQATLAVREKAAAAWLEISRMTI